jgi:hypothetical protein
MQSIIDKNVVFMVIFDKLLLLDFSHFYNLRLMASLRAIAKQPKGSKSGRIVMELVTSNTGLSGLRQAMTAF